jgi:serine/threonine protein phosphatase PrpC
VIDFLRKILRKKETSAADIQTAPLAEDLNKTNIPPAQKLQPPQLLIGTGQSVGMQREHNEDCVFCFNSVLSGNGDAVPLGIFIVADGMGGHQHGEVASGVAIRALSSYLIRKVLLPYYNIRSDIQMEPLHEILQQGIREAQLAVVKNAPGGGTTLTAAFVLGDQVTVAHVGDSRAYFVYPDGRVNPVTRDHSLVRRLQELGQITEDEAAVHPNRNVLYRAIGQGEPFDADISTHMLPRPGTLLVCSDGLWGVVPEDDIARIINTYPAPTIASRELVRAANELGGPDNISVILVQYPN